MLQGGEFRLRPQVGEHHFDASIRPGDRPVDTFMRQEQRSLHAVFIAKRLQRRAQAFEARHGNKMIKRRHEERGGVIDAVGHAR